MMVGAKY